MHKSKLWLLGLALVVLLPAALPIAGAKAATGAKYLIVFLGDGMGAEHVRAGAYYVCGTSRCFSFESFPARTTMTHANASGGVTDSAAAGTAMATGVKVNNGAVSVRLPGNGAELRTLLEIYRDRGLATGLVTESYLTDASPAAFGAHDTSRGNYGPIFGDYVDQTHPNVLLGGGGSGFDQSVAAARGYTVVTNTAGLADVGNAPVDRLAGGFGSGRIPPAGFPGRSGDLPTLPQMTGAALQVVGKDPDGFFLLIEHQGPDVYSPSDLTNVVRSVAEFSDAVQRAIEWVDDPVTPADWSNTLMIVLADHETGGLTSVVNRGAGSVPGGTWTASGHTSTPVPVYARGAGSAQITTAQIDNTAIFGILSPATPDPCAAIASAAGAATWIDAIAPTVARGADAKLVVDGSPDNGILIRWDLSAIPPWSRVTSAQITFHLPDANDQSANTYPFYALQRSWSEGGATWLDAAPGSSWSTAGAQATPADRLAAVLALTPAGGTPPADPVTYVNALGLRQLGRWATGAVPNYGFAILDYSDVTSDGLRFSSFRSSNAPVLTANMCPLPVNSGLGLSAVRTATGVKLAWTHGVLSAGYQVWRGEAPFGDGGSGSVVLGYLDAPGSGTRVEFADREASALSGAGYYYVVLQFGAGGEPRSVSNPVGTFNFALQTGGP